MSNRLSYGQYHRLENGNLAPDETTNKDCGEDRSDKE